MTVNNQNVKMLSDCNPCTVNLFLFMHLSLEANREFASLQRYDVLQTFFFFEVFFFPTLARICDRESSSCAVHSDRTKRKRVGHKVTSREPKCVFERLTDCCNKVINKKLQ